MNEKLECGCKNTGCHFCNNNDKIYVTVKSEYANSDEACLHICSECNDKIIIKELTDQDKKELKIRIEE